MIISFAHKGLEAFHYKHSLRGIQPKHKKKLKDILDTLEVSPDTIFTDKTYKAHKLIGNLKDYYAVSVDENYRVIFKITNEGIELVDYLDYHR